MASSALCQKCCVQVHAHGQQTAQTALTACACGTSGVCQSQCASEFCAQQPTYYGDACETCMSNALAPDAGAAGCYNQVTQACQSDPDCGALGRCTGNCP
jgi:hypothetical protein